jgi:type I restriction enzyme R subunit
MSSVGEREKVTQDRVAKLFCETLGYRHIGNWEDRKNNRNIEPEHLRGWLKKQGHRDSLIERAIRALEKAAEDTTRSLYDRNRDVYTLLRYGVKVLPDVGENTVNVWAIDWENPDNNDFAIAEEVSVSAANAKAHGKRPDIVIFVNGIALGVLELKRSTVSVAEGVRQNLDNQKKEFIQPFFSTLQFVMAGNDVEGLRYGTIETREKYYLAWKENEGRRKESGLLDEALTQLCGKARFLELIHDFIVFDAGTKKLCRHNQYFGVRAAQDFVQRREGGIIWHTQGSGKSLTMVWLAKWIRENVRDARVLIITDRTELDEQIEKVFLGVNEKIYRTDSGADLVTQLNATTPWLICSLVQKFGRHPNDDEADVFLQQMKRSLAGFSPKGNLFVFVDECHRTQSGKLHDGMKDILPGAVFIGFTGTPLLKADKKRTFESFGRYIHTYKFNEAVKDKVVLDLRYEARNIDQSITSPEKIDQWFMIKTQGLTDLAKAQLKRRWSTLRTVLSSRSRLEKIAADILMDMGTRDRLVSGHGNALLVSGSIFEACKFYELFNKTDLKGKCAIITSYAPATADIKGEESGEGETENVEKYIIYRQMLAEWFNQPPEMAINKVEAFEKAVKKKFIDEPGQMKLLIVVDKLLTGFDAPPATYLYIDKEMRNHGLFQAICRVNRLDGDDKDFGYIIDYQDLFKSLAGAVNDYTSGAFDLYDKADVLGLLENRLQKARERLTDALETVRALCEQVDPPKDSAAHLRYFCAKESGSAVQLKENEPSRLSLYKSVAALIRAYANIAGEMAKAGYSEKEAAAVRREMDHFEKVRTEVKLASGDYIDLKMYEPAMRHLIDTYIRAEESQKVSAFDDLSLIQLIVDRGAGAVGSLPEGIRHDPKAVLETIENNVRKLIIDESPVNPKFYEKMSELLDDLIRQRNEEAFDYAKYLAKIVQLTRQIKNPSATANYPGSINSPAKQALYDNLGRDVGLSLKVDTAVKENRQDDWRDNEYKTKKVRNAIADVVPAGDEIVDYILTLVKNQNEY